MLTIEEDREYLSTHCVVDKDYVPLYDNDLSEFDESREIV